MMNSIARDRFHATPFQPDPALTCGGHPDYLYHQQQIATYMGLVAMALPAVLAIGAVIGTACFHNSMSHFYYTPVLGSVFIGGLIFIGGCLLAFRGENTTEKWLATLAGVGAIGVAIWPAKGPGCAISELHLRPFVHMTWDADLTQFVPVKDAPISFALTAHAHLLHSLSAIALFMFMAYYCLAVFTRVVPERHLTAEGALTPAKAARNRAYRTFGVLILVAMSGLAVRAIFFAPPPMDQADWWNSYNLTFWLEAVAIWTFGISWLVKGQRFAFLWPDPQPNQRKTARRPRGAAVVLIS